jgi:hypothetical protein
MKKITVEDNKSSGPMYQNVIITLSDGTVCMFTGNAFVTNPDAETRRIRNIQFTVPKPLPEGYAFELMEGN